MRACMTTASPTARRRRGFTMTELMVTVAVVAVLSTIAAPSMRQMVATQRVRSAASALTESLWMARSEALKRNDNVTFRLVNGTLTGWDIVQGTTGVPTVPAPSLHRQDGFSNVTATPSTNADVLFTFNAYGRLAPTATWVNLEVTGANAYRCVRISTTGRAVVQETACP
jgi:type IV fimbrial biogenesis protein FimT